MMLYNFLASIEFEATVVGIVCVIFMSLFVLAGIRQIKKDAEDES